MSTKVFSTVRASRALTVLAAAGSVAGLAACSSNEATYRPAPHYTNTSPQTHSCGSTSTQPTYTQPSSTSAQPPPVTAPPKKAGGGGCGAGKCG